MKLGEPVHQLPGGSMTTFKYALQKELDGLFWGRANARERFSLRSLIEYVSKN